MFNNNLNANVRYCVICGASSPRKVICTTCFEATEWHPPVYCAACGSLHSYEGGLRLFCQACWITIRATLEDTTAEASPLTCQDLAQLGYWNESDCCPDCHVEGGEYLHALQLDGCAALLCCRAVHAALRLMSRLELRLTAVAAEEEREGLD